MKVLRTLTVQQGPGEIVVALKLQFQPDLTTATLVAAINEFEQRLQARGPRGEVELRRAGRRGLAASPRAGRSIDPV